MQAKVRWFNPSTAHRCRCTSKAVIRPTNRWPSTKNELTLSVGWHAKKREVHHDRHQHPSHPGASRRRPRRRLGSNRIPPEQVRHFVGTTRTIDATSQWREITVEGAQWSDGRVERRITLGGLLPGQLRPAAALAW